MSESDTRTEQSTLQGREAERVECEYYDGCTNPALYIDEILHYGEGEKPVRMCESCAEEHLEVEDNEVQRLKPEDRYVGEGSKKIELTELQRKRLEEIKEECSDPFTPQPTDSQILSSLLDTWDAVNKGHYSERYRAQED
jgi:hypothetical protein